MNPPAALPRERAEPMNLTLLDAALPTFAEKPPIAALESGIGNTAPTTFEALLAGLTVSVAELPGTALPRTGKTLPGAEEAGDEALAFTTKGDSFGPLEALLAPSASLAADAPTAPEVLPKPDATALPNMLAPSPVMSPLAVAPIPAGTNKSVTASTVPTTPIAATAVTPATASPETTASASPSPLPASAPASSEKPHAHAENRFEHSAAPAQQTALQVPTAKLETSPPELVGRPAPAEIVAPKPAQQAMPSLAVLPIAAPARAETGSPPLRRDSKFSLVSLTIAPDASIAAPIPAPITLASVAAVSDAAPTHPQFSNQVPAAQPLALPDHRALVDALVRARADRDPGVSVAIDTREFGAVALRFETLQSATGERGLQVALSSGDPGFDRAVASAAAAQAALADQSSRNPANRADPAPARSSEQSGDLSSGHGSQPDQRAQQRSAADTGWRESRSRNTADRLSPSDDRPATPRPERRRGSIFA